MKRALTAPEAADRVVVADERLKPPQEACSMEMAKEAAFRFGRSASVEGIQQATSSIPIAMVRE